jgi:hypothetical protein
VSISIKRCVILELIPALWVSANRKLIEELVKAKTLMSYSIFKLDV